MVLAIAETVFHFEEFAKDSADPFRMEDVSVLLGPVDSDFEDIDATPEPLRSQIRDPTSYGASQPHAQRLRDEGAPGLVYPGVRRIGGVCIGAFKPRAVGLPQQQRRLKYRWSGASVDRYFDYRRDLWVDL